MMINNSNLYKDPLTGMKNLFALIECDLESIFGDNGTALFVDLKNLSVVNEKFSRETGDIYIKNLAEIINAEIPVHIKNTIGVEAYRSGGDEFIIRFPSGLEAEIDIIGEKTNDKINQKMLLSGVQGTGIHFAKWSYSSKIYSTSFLLRQCFIALFRIRGCDQESNELPRWADWMIESMFLRVKETLQLLQHSNSMALSDEISQLPNHRAADCYLKDAFDEYHNKQSTFSVLFIDGDNLKKYNYLGYQFGNEMIMNLGKAITSALRHEDKVFRWLSGDEFLVLLNNTSKEKAFALAERIRVQVEEKMKKFIYPVTISVGVSNCPADGSSLETVLAVAEAANAKAKEAGKNCVV